MTVDETPLNHRERDAYAPPNCAECGRLMDVSWLQITYLDDDPADPETRQWVPGTAVCPPHGKEGDA